MNKTVKVTRREKREHLEQFHLAVELAKLIKHFFPGLIDKPAQADERSKKSKLYYLSKYCASHDTHPFVYILYQQHEKNKPEI